ncbi:hypothetical protein Kpol_1048p57 [Vanderwaltozyma polyspora DSM 70294]|uniref:Altered inheritance of mitochondria protein 4 n=1 Tax=Vanderwaltozyma polyspora (strain ATCC 22028 / DSM 70294 / BCRC 21397 / CBS 2163 / NBRC 10782 / NRRL Y-8283 / UCD 57-17) TaxID=436907 RepID=AIM4_VANPO|nr:uncharacterized protein Kpol_1048p57 [Vanderwaltozyma polyspora DSM 70294]A7TGL9.1 RecName: Full=Altered inheritance of mitochondria protein 4 [Vanderwaltozyma polyspora DSM 70294]EDO18626.1 hypothetical protein Kpol_1048p57 [Vanderwaltozyma polyspora DSM 70294]
MNYINMKKIDEENKANSGDDTTESRKKQKTKNNEEHEIRSDELFRKSIFFDSHWNPNGVAPPNHRNVFYNPKTFVHRGKPIIAKLMDLDEEHLTKLISKTQK